MAAKIEPFYIHVGNRIRTYRIKLGLTQDQLGRLLIPPTSRVSIANVESGKQRILSHTLVQIAEALKAEPADLLRMDPPGLASSKNNHAIADELVYKAGLSKSVAKKLVENPHALSEYKEEKS